MVSNHIIIKFFIHLKTLYEDAWNPYLLIMDYYRFLNTPLKVHYVMATQKLFMKLIQCDYVIFNYIVNYRF
jgi:hypothetical protein